MHCLLFPSLTAHYRNALNHVPSRDRKREKERVQSLLHLFFCCGVHSIRRSRLSLSIHLWAESLVRSCTYIYVSVSVSETCLFFLSSALLFPPTMVASVTSLTSFYHDLSYRALAYISFFSYFSLCFCFLSPPPLTTPSSSSSSCFSSEARLCPSLCIHS